MAEHNDGGSAFPIHEMNSDGTVYCHHFGMSLLDYFAGQVLVGFWANPDTAGSGEAIARHAYNAAAAMIVEREKRMATGGGGGTL